MGGNGTAGADKFKIMMVDDSPDTLTTLSQGLQRQALNVSAFSDPQYALSEFKPDYYDMVILDLSMPRLNGFELAEKILAKDPNVRICFLSAFETHEIGTKAKFKGKKSISYVKKPIAPSKLARYVIDTINHAAKD